MKQEILDTQARRGTAQIFFGAFLFACLLFWWLPSLLFRAVGLEDPVKASTLSLSILGVVAFTGGYLISPIRLRTEIPEYVLDDCEGLAWQATVWLAAPAVILAIRFYLYRATVAYGEGQGISALDQVVLYAHMYAGFLYLGSTGNQKLKPVRILLASILITIPRLIISLHWGRFFLAQAVVPILFVALARGWLRMNAKRWAGFAVIALVIVFVPSIVRGDQIFGQDNIVHFFASGGTLKLLQDNENLNLSSQCPPLMISLTDGFVPYNALGICTIDLWGKEDLPATLDRILAYNDPTTEGTLEGPGANFLLELYLSGGLAMLIIGSAFFGFSNRCFVDWISRRSLFAGIWAECLSRSLFAPRNTLGYVYQRIPTLVIAVLAIALVIFVARRPIRSSMEGTEAPSP